MFGCCRAAAIRASRVKRSRKPEDSARSGAMILMAARRCEVHVLGAIDDAHAAAADPLLDPVARDDRAEARVVARVRHHAPIMDALAGMRLLLAGGRPRCGECAAVRGRRSPGAVPAACTADPARRRRGVAADAAGGRRGDRRHDAAALRAAARPARGSTAGPRSWRSRSSSPGGERSARRGAAAARAGGAAGAARAAGRARGGRGGPGGGAAPRHDEASAALDTLRRLALAAEYRDDNTHEHTAARRRAGGAAGPPPRP